MRIKRTSPSALADRDPILAEYSRLAPDYDRRWSSYIEATLRQTRSRLVLRPGESLLDVGCGTGVFLSMLSADVPTAHLTGVDPTREMLEVARKTLGETVALELSHAESLPFPDSSFDVVVSTSAFHYFHNPLVALKEMARVLRPGGRLVVTDWCGDYLTSRVIQILLRLFNRAHTQTYREDQIRLLFEQTGFTDIQIERFKIDWIWGLMTAVAQRPPCFDSMI